VEVLFRRPTAAHVRLLGDRLNDPHPAVRGRARQALRELAAEAEWKEPVIREGARVLGGADWRGLEQAALLLGGLDHKPAAPRLLELLRHGRWEVYVTAAWGLRRLAVPDTLPAVLAFYDERYRSLAAVGPTGAAIDNQLSQLGQLLGRTRYRPADAVLRRLIPQANPTKNPAGPEARAAAIWAIGLLHEGREQSDLVRPLVGRLTAVSPSDLEDERVRRMAAVALGQMKAAAAVGPLRQFYTAKGPSLDPVNNACGWALERITGEPVPPPGAVEVVLRDWFLAPLD
jgi:HEAT repeat protein